MVTSLTGSLTRTRRVLPSVAVAAAGRCEAPPARASEPRGRARGAVCSKPDPRVPGLPPLFLFLPPSLPPSLPLPLSPSLSFSLPLFLPPSLSPSLPLPLPPSLSLSLSLMERGKTDPRVRAIPGHSILRASSASAVRSRGPGQAARGPGGGSLGGVACGRDAVRDSEERESESPRA